MTLKPIQGAPIGAPIPDFPSGEPGPAAVPAAPVAPRPVAPLPTSVPPSSNPFSSTKSRAPLGIRGDDDSMLTFQAVPELPAISRASLVISIAGGATGDHSARMTPRLDLATDEAKAFLTKLRDASSPINITDGRTALQVEFTSSTGGAIFVISQPGQPQTIRRFSAGSSADVKAMAEQLLFALGP